MLSHFKTVESTLPADSRLGFQYRDVSFYIRHFIVAFWIRAYSDGSMFHHWLRWDPKMRLRLFANRAQCRSQICKRANFSSAVKWRGTYWEYTLRNPPLWWWVECSHNLFRHQKKLWNRQTAVVLNVIPNIMNRNIIRPLLRCRL